MVWDKPPILCRNKINYAHRERRWKGMSDEAKSSEIGGYMTLFREARDEEIKGYVLLLQLIPHVGNGEMRDNWRWSSKYGWYEIGDPVRLKKFLDRGDMDTAFAEIDDMLDRYGMALKRALVRDFFGSGSVVNPETIEG
jgi:hypothetical protein